MGRNREFESAFLHAYADDAKFEVEIQLQQLAPDLLYHCASHTLDYVYPESVILATAEGFNEDELLLIAVAALYHDMGFVEQYPENEPIGAEKARKYAENSNSDTLRTGSQIIFDSVLNTNMRTPPKNKFEEVIRDADLSVMGKPEFIEWNHRLKQEVLQHPESGMYQSALDDQKWAKSQLKFLKTHQWFTEAATTMYQKQKEENIRLFKEKYITALRTN